MSDVAFADEADDNTEDQIDDADLGDDVDDDQVDADGDEEAGEDEEKVSSRVAELERVANDKAKLADKERNRRRDAERQVRELNERLSRLEASSKGGGEEDLLALIDSIPDGDDDPIGKIEAVTRALKAFRAQQGAERDQETREAAQRAEVSRIVSVMEEYEADFSDDHPDYVDAAKHYKDARREELSELGYAGQALERALAADLLGLAERAINSGRDPAEAVYNLAKKRGFAAGADKTTEKLQRIAGAAKAGARASGGKASAGRLTPEAVSQLKGAAFDKAWAQLREQERRAG